jgi:Nucleotidyl transferase AbiEii toxin, Type IV TA system
MAVDTAYERTFTKTALLSRSQMPAVIPVADVIRLLNRAKLSFVLVGAYGLAGWRKESRATEDVDVVVAARQLRKAVQTLVRAYPNLEPVDLPAVIRLKDRETEAVLIDVIKPLQQPYREVFKNTQRETIKGQSYRVPTLEMALVMKFSAMTSSHRPVEDKYRDAHDFVRMAKNNPEIDEGKMAQLASLIYPSGGKDVLEMVRKAKANETLDL